MDKIISLDQLDLVNGLYSYADYLTWKFEQTVELIKGKILPMAAPSRNGYMTSTNQPKQIRTFSASFNQTFASFAICKNWTTKDVWAHLI